MRSAKLLTILVLSFWVSVNALWAQCSLITANGSSQNPSTVCAPVNFTMNVWFKFLIPVDTTVVEIRFEWNDGTGATTTVAGHWNAAGDSVWAEASHLYLPDNECAKTADAYLIYDGDVCTSSGHQEQTFSTWGTDEENSGTLYIDPVTYYVCEGEDIINFTFDDASTFNCNLGLEPDNPNRYFRWVQFIYNTYNQGGDRIPQVTINDGAGTTYNMTDAAGNFAADHNGPIVRIPIPADAPTETSYAISAPAGGVAGDIFEITLRNWNVCNPYDNIPTDGVDPVDLINGDNPPIEITARIEIIAPPPLTYNALNEFCTGDNIILNASAGGSEVRWYADAGRSILLHTGTSFNPQLPPVNLNTTIPGSYTYWITSSAGICESAASQVDVVIYQSPMAAQAGPNQTICADSVQLQADPPSVGTGTWTTSGAAVIDDINNPSTWVRQLDAGSNTFTWTITNGICNTTDQLTIISDRQPDAAFAGLSDSLCSSGNIALNATPPNVNGQGHWLIVQGGGSVSDTAAPDAQLQNPSVGNNRLLWRVGSQFGACPVTTDTVDYFVDLSPGMAQTALAITLCQYSAYTLSANAAQNGGSGMWSVIEGSNDLVNPADSVTNINNLHEGDNRYEWRLTSAYGICPVSADTMRIHRDLSPGIAHAGTDIALCLENSDTLQANAPLHGTGSWQVLVNPSGTAPVFSPNANDPQAIFSVLPGNEGEYTLQWTLQNGVCISQDTLQIDFGVPPPPGFAGHDSTICGTRTWLQSNTFAQGHGIWTQLSGTGTTNFDADEYDAHPEITIPSGREGSYAFEWRLISGACAPSADTVKVTFLRAPSSPSISGVASCGPDSLLLNASLSETDAVVEWFDALASGSALTTGTSYTTPWLSTSRIYYTESVDTITGCRSPRLPVTADIFPIPNVPLLQGDTLCGPGNTHVSGSIAAPAHTIRWFQDANLVIPIGDGLSLSHPLFSSQKLWGIAVDTINTCVSPSDSVQVVVHPAVPDPITRSDSACGTGNLRLYAHASSVNHSLYWYSSTTSGSAIHLGDSLLLFNQDSTSQYWISEVNDSTGCTSQRIPIIGRIHPIPSNPILTDVHSCGADAFTLQASGDITISSFRWFNAPSGGTLLSEADSLNTGLLTANTSYWISGVNTTTGCESLREQADVFIHPNPAPILINGPTVVLKGQTGLIFSTSGPSTSNYNWTVPAGIVLNENNNDFIRLSFPTVGSYTLSVAETSANGCPGTPISHPITVISDSMSVDIGLYNQNACTGVAFELQPWLYGGTPPYTYTWTGDAHYLSSNASLFTNFNPPGTGTYFLHLQVTDVNLKTAFDSVEITVYTSPTAQIQQQDEIVCVGNTLPLQVLTTGHAAVSHLWSGPVHNLSAYTVQEPVYTPRQPDTAVFHYQLTDIHGCKASDSTRLYSDIPVAYFEVATAPGCSPLEVNFNNQSVRGVSYSWDFGDGQSSTREEPAHTYINQSPQIQYYPIELEVTSALGCTDRITQYAMVWPNPQATLNAIPERGCSPIDITLFSTPGNMHYYWDFGDGTSLTSGDFSTTHTYLAEGETDRQFTAKVITESSLNCIDSAFLNLDIYARPEADFTLSPRTDTFPDSEFTLINRTVGTRWNMDWTFGNGTTFEGANPGTISYENPGNYTIQLRAQSDHCADSVTRTAYLYPARPLAKFARPEPGCEPHTIQFINNSDYADDFLWEFGDGSISTSPEPQYTYYQSGIYRIKLTVRGPGGEASYSDTARVHILPHSFFDMAPRHVYVNDEEVNFFNLSEDADDYEWDFGDGNQSTQFNPKHKYTEEGTYDITLKVKTDNECYDLYVMENAVLVEPSGVVDFPNVFRPDSPLEENRVFLPGVIDHVDEYHLMIYNRWGELIYESFSQDIGWDGYFKGERAKQDVYIWKVTGTYTDGRGFTKTGDVTLLY